MVLREAECRVSEVIANGLLNDVLTLQPTFNPSMWTSDCWLRRYWPGVIEHCLINTVNTVADNTGSVYMEVSAVHVVFLVLRWYGNASLAVHGHQLVGKKKNTGTCGRQAPWKANDAHLVLGNVYGSQLICLTTKRTITITTGMIVSPLEYKIN